MIRWLWKIIVGEKPTPPKPPCARECQWSVMEKGSIVDPWKVKIGDWYVLRCDTCGLLKNHENSQ